MMKTYYESGLRKRVLMIAVFFAAWSVVLLGRLVDLQILKHDRSEAQVLKQNQDKKKAEPERGNIYDRNGRILACSLLAPNVYINPVEKEKSSAVEEKLRRLQKALGLTDKERDQIRGRLEKNYTFTYVKKRVSRDEADQVKALKLDGVGFEPATKRYYPLGPLACHILGGVNAQDQGIAGVEYRYEPLLRGKEGEQIVFVDSRRREYQAQIVKPAVRGQDLYLTIDAVIQHIAEVELEKAVKDHGAGWGTVIVMDPSNGEILAMANYPNYDPNEYPSDPEMQMNRAVKYNYAPGSTFKIVAAATAVEEKAVSFSDTFDCSSGFVKAGPLTIKDHIRLGVLSFPQILIESSNVGTVLFARRLDPADYCKKIFDFGFGRRTGIDLPAEEPGLVRPYDKWNKKISLSFISIGYEVMVTPLQVLNAMNVYATRGFLARPHLALNVSDGAEKIMAPAPSKARVIEEATADELISRAFEKVVEEGTGKTGRLDGYDIAGKTGTAQKIDPATGAYTTSRHTASFVGFVPADKPALSMIVVLDDPKEGFYYGGQVCAPVFRDIARKTLRYLRVPPTKPFEDKIVTANNRKTKGEVR